MPAHDSARPISEARSATSKRARTRRRVLEAALQCVAEKGVAGATATEIAERCGLSWGVIQYHFKDRVGLYLALLESGVEGLESSLAGLETATSDPADRVASLVDGMWGGMRRDGYRVLLEIQLQLGREPAHRARVRRQMRQMRSQLDDAWRKALPEFDPERVAKAERLATTSLRGLALERAVEGNRAAYAAEREAIIEALLPILGLEAD